MSYIRQLHTQVDSPRPPLHHIQHTQNMSSNYGRPSIDTSQMPPSQLEVLGRLAFERNRVSGFLPHIIGYAQPELGLYDEDALIREKLISRSFFDGILLGLVAVTWGLWFIHARPTERRWIRWIMVRSSFWRRFVPVRDG
jgi:hypothetical protein